MLDLFKDDELVFLAMQDAYNDVGVSNAIWLNHYELAELTSFTNPQDWKKFLTEPRVADFINEELALIKQNKARKLIQNIDTNFKSPGLAQILKELREGDKDRKVDGPTYVYCYIPPNEQEMGAENIEVIQEDPFKITD